MHAIKAMDLIVTHGRHLTLVRAAYRFSRTASTMLKSQPSFSRFQVVTMEAAGLPASKENPSTQVRISESTIAKTA